MALPPGRSARYLNRQGADRGTQAGRYAAQPVFPNECFGMDDTSRTKTKAFVVAGTHSGVGKTTVTLALLRAAHRRGLACQPFKIGPDFIDAAYHEEAAGRPSINLDLWMMGAETVKGSFARYSVSVDIAIIEAMGALYDGENGTERGSAAHLSKLLNVPIILVIDIWGMTRSAIPLLNGFLSFDRDLTFAGFVMNRAGSARHAAMVEEALPEALRRLSLGYILRRNELEIPERHLGLVTVQENPQVAEARRAALDSAGAGLRIDGLLPQPRSGEAVTSRRHSVADRTKRARIAIARDSAFAFYYHENLALLEDAGAELVPFSPTSDPSLPPDVVGLYIGGGFPESFSIQLSANSTLINQIRELAAEEMPIYAECGGFMYLGRSLTTAMQPVASMVGVFGIDAIMDPEHLVIRYVSIRTLLDSPLGPAGTVARGQEFHQSRIIGTRAGRAIYHVTATSGEQYQEGELAGCALGSYVHLHFSSNPRLCHSFVERCAAWRGSRI